MSSIDFQKVADAVEKSSEEIKNLMFSTELGEKLNSIAVENNLDEETAFKMTDEVGYVILGLKSRFSFLNSLEEIGVKKEIAAYMAKEIESKIFSELDKIDDKAKGGVEEYKKRETIRAEPNGNQPSEDQLSEKQSSTGVGGDFEQIILNQARAMQPAKPAGWVPDNLPTGEPQAEKTQNAIHNYVTGSDPYREPVE